MFKDGGMIHIGSLYTIISKRLPWCKVGWNDSAEDFLYHGFGS